MSRGTGLGSVRPVLRGGLRGIDEVGVEGDGSQDGLVALPLAVVGPQQEAEVQPGAGVLLVGRDGRVFERFEGALSVRELKAAVERLKAA